LEVPAGLKPAYFSYSFNGRLEGGGDTEPFILELTRGIKPPYFITLLTTV